MARPAGLCGPARHEVSLWARAWTEGQARGQLRHGTAGMWAAEARHATARARPDGHLYLRIYIYI